MQWVKGIGGYQELRAGALQIDEPALAASVWSPASTT
jgi:hypothetical protein